MDFGIGWSGHQSWPDSVHETTSKTKQRETMEEGKGERENEYDKIDFGHGKHCPISLSWLGKLGEHWVIGEERRATLLSWNFNLHTKENGGRNCAPRHLAEPGDESRKFHEKKEKETRATYILTQIDFGDWATPDFSGQFWRRIQRWPSKIDMRANYGLWTGCIEAIFSNQSQLLIQCPNWKREREREIINYIQNTHTHYTGHNNKWTSQHENKWRIKLKYIYFYPLIHSFIHSLTQWAQKNTHKTFPSSPLCPLILMKGIKGPRGRAGKKAQWQK